MYDRIPDNEKTEQRALSIPIELSRWLALQTAADQRPLGERATRIDILLALVQKGLALFQDDETSVKFSRLHEPGGDATRWVNMQYPFAMMDAINKIAGRIKRGEVPTEGRLKARAVDVVLALLLAGWQAADPVEYDRLMNGVKPETI